MPTDITVTELKETVTVTGGTTSITVTGDSATVAVATTSQPVSVVETNATFTISTTTNKADVGLGNVDNTSDANKPVGTATQTALDTKLNKSGGTLTGALTLAADPTQNLQAATKSYVDGQVSAVPFITSTDDVPEGDVNLYFTTSAFDTRLATKSTTNLAEGSNLYHTTARARSSISGTGSITYNNTTGVISYTGGANPVTTDELPEGTTNKYYTDTRVNSAFDTRLATKTTSNLNEGTNLYYTSARANTDFDTRLATKATTNLAEGTNLYYTSARANTDFDGRLATKSTTNLAEGTNLYHTTARARASVSGSTGITYTEATGAIAVDSTIATKTYADSAAASAAAAIVDSSPATLDTLNELAAALGDDPNFATTISTALGNKLNTADFEIAFDGHLAEKTTTNLTEGTNLYYTDTRARGSVSGGTGISYNNTTGVITNTITQYTDALARGALSAGTGVSYNSSTGAISIGQAVGTGDNPAFAGVTAGNLSVGISTDNTIVSTDTNGNITLAPNGTGDIITTFSNGGNLVNNRNYVIGAIRNSTTEGLGDIWAVNATGPSGPLRGVSIDNSADTTKSPGTILRSYGTVAALRGRLVFEKARGFPPGVSTGPAALAAGDLIGTIDATGYTSTGWVNNNIAAAVPGFLGFNATESWVSNTNLGTAFALTMAPQATTITSGADLRNVISAQPEVLILKGDRIALAQAKTIAFNATGCSVSGTTLTIGTLTTGTIATGQVIQLATGSPINGHCIIANISGSGSGSTWTLGGSPGTLTGLNVNAYTGFFSGPSLGTTSDALQNLRLIQNTIVSSNGTTQITTSSGGSTLGLRGDVININNAANTSTYATFGPTSLSLAASGTTYATIGSGSTTFTSVGRFTLARTTAGTGLLLTQQTANANPANNDSTDFRLGITGTSTSSNFAKLDGFYKSSGDNEIGLSVSTDSFTANSDRIYIGSRASTKILATPSGGGSVATIMEITDAKILNNRAHRNAITTGTVARGGTYSVPAAANGSISLTITAGTGITYIDVDAVAADAGTGGMYSILIYNNSGDNNIDVQVRNNGANIGLSNNLDIGHRAMASVYIVGDYAACEIMDAA